MTGEMNYKVGLVIKDRHENLGLTQTEVARYVGVDRSSVSRWESGEAVFAYYPPITVVISGAFWRIYP